MSRSARSRFGSRPASRRNLFRALGLAASLAIASPALAACGNSSTSDTAAVIGSDLEEITTLAQEEGQVQLIAYPETWANYKGHFEQFQEKYGVDTPVDSPDASSAEELQAVQNLKGQPSQPDVLDLGYSFTEPAIQQDLIEPYKPSNFDSIPDELKDPDGMWVGAYYGVISVGVDLDQVDAPESWEDLLGEEYRGKVALPGDPRSGASSIATVMAASLANGGSLDDIGPGIDYFAEMAEVGNLVAINDTAGALTTGQAAVVFDWNYNWLGSSEQLERDGVNFEYFVLPTGVYGNYYAQPVTKDSPNPNAARLWVDWLTSDEGAEQYALGGAIPARFEELSEAGKLSDEALASLPDPEIVSQVEFATLEQGEAANKKLAAEWAQKVRY
jgi:putative spermidine/putrescine transport system substrate-binding protein